MTGSTGAMFRKFNPGTFQSDAEVRNQFAVRHRDLAVLMETLRGNVGAPSCQHALVIGRRGMGKTMLLARVAAEVRGDRALSHHLLVLRLAEESHEIQDLADFWSEVLFHLARECAVIAPGIAEELRGAHEDLTRNWRGPELERRAQATVLEAADRLERQLVVMVENLQDLTESAGDDFGWGLRKVMQTEPTVVLIATATSRFRALDEASAPFFELFRTVWLDRLDTADCRRLWERVTGRPIAERKIRPLEILTGGNPRLVVIVSSFGSGQSLRRLMEQLVALVDEHTEYFRGHLQGIAKTERRVYLAVIDQWLPSTSQEVAERARLDIRTTSALLGRLVDRGVVEVKPAGKKRRYAAAERLYCIYYKLRRERDDAAVVRLLVRFLAEFYSKDELADFARMMLAEAGRDLSTARWLSTALAEPRFADVSSGILFADLRRALDDDDLERIAVVTQQVIDLDRETGVPDGLLAPVYVAKVHLLLRRDDPVAAEALCRRVLARFGGSGDDAALVCVARAIGMRGEALEILSRNDEALGCFEEMSRRFGERRDWPFASIAVQARLDRVALLVRLGREEEAARDAGRLIETTKWKDLPTWRRQFTEASLVKAAALRNRDDADGRSLEEAIVLCDRVGDLLSGDSDERSPILIRDALLMKGDLLAFGGRPDDALTALEQVDALAPDETDEGFRGERSWGDWRLAEAVRADALYQAGRRPEAEEAVRGLYAEFDPDAEGAIARLVGECIRFVAAGASPADLVGILDEAPPGSQEEDRKELRRKTEAITPLLDALRLAASLPARAPVEVREVANDLLADFERERERRRRARLRSRYELADEEAVSRVAEPGPGWAE